MMESSLDIVSERKRYVPEGYVSTGPADPTGSEIAGEPKVSAASSIIPVWSVRVGDTCLCARHPFPVKLTTGDDHFFVESETLGIYSVGHTLQVAISDFSEQLIEIFRHYQSLRPQQVTGDARRLRQLFRELFVEEQVSDPQD